ncbi:Brp/Blh family beta-carotene 15,15'-dioxygenase [Flavobacterium cucumis]|uniref:Probable beta-carotene 15,15'-dioxygenase n=1 Tax=Flavobacterium cucumis TaxID=416016 RepID=A0A1M7ZXL5_9FLAO|nr:Brp/Blh family beta-carotene 15,15'-dioxygenase [Flavobacterium cucumis]SHO73608.1 beta-carotene 15,15'-monooxygenase, Brp/Blh family [Flavobacterium cucumis]
MYKVQQISVLTSFLALWLTSYLSDDNQVILGFLLIFTFGILHGANDLVLINHLETKKKYTFIKILTSYVTVVLISVFLFTKIPILALLLFILVSAYHFGEQHWHHLIKDCNKKLIKMFQLVYGLEILMLLFVFNQEEVIEIINKIAQVKLSNNLIINAFLIITTLLLVTTVIIYRKSHLIKKWGVEQLFYLFLLCILFKSSNLIWSFAIYFIFWHSIPSIYEQIVFLYGKYNLQNFVRYLKTAFFYWLFSIMGIGILFFTAKDMIIFDALFFSFLASITFPHVLVIVKMYEK